MNAHSRLDRRGARVVRVSFALPAGTTAERVHLVGDFNDWSRTACPLARSEDGWGLALDLAPGRAYQFRYLLDDREWLNDPQADGYVRNHYGDENSVVVTDPARCA